MADTAIKIGPADLGRHMSLAEFDTAEAVDGNLYELGRGKVIVTDVPGKPHLAIFAAIRRQFSIYEAAHPEEIHAILGGGECKIMVAGLNSERHPDLAIYKNPPPEGQVDLWAVWIPELLIEIVSTGSERRDYVEKREEYLQFGVREYWIVDGSKQEMLVLQRSRGVWVEKTVRPPELYRPVVLSNFEFNLGTVLAAK